MLEKREEPEFAAIARPSEHAILLLRQVLAEEPSPKIAEVGIGIGATSLELCRVLDGRGHISFFDFEERLVELAADLSAHGFTNFRTHGNSRLTYDSYGWTLAKVLQEMRRSGEDGVFDFIYFDGCHLFHHDAAATVICKELLKPGAILLMDDFDWSIAVSPTMRPSVTPSITEDFTQEQIEISHVALICELFLDSDPAFVKVDIGYRSHEHRRAYRRVDDVFP